MSDSSSNGGESSAFGSGRRKRRQSTAVGRLMKKIAQEGNKVAIRFCEDNETHHLLWTELLTVDLELPFEKYEDLKVGTKVMAPWYTPDDDISFSEAFVVSDEPEKKGTKELKKKREKSTKQPKQSPKKISKQKARLAAARKAENKVLKAIKDKDDEECDRHPAGDSLIANETISTPSFTTDMTAMHGSKGSLASGEAETTVTVEIPAMISTDQSDTPAAVHVSSDSLVPAETSIHGDCSAMEATGGSTCTVEAVKDAHSPYGFGLTPPDYGAGYGMYTPNYPPLVRRHTYPGYPLTLNSPTMSEMEYNSFASEDGSGISSVSQTMRSNYRMMSPVPGPGQSPELQFVYNRWITPLKLSLERIESKFDTLQHQLVVQAETSLTLSKPSLKHPGPQLESSPAVVNKPSLPVSPNLAQSQLQPETSTSAEESVESGTYLGYPKNVKYRVWIPKLRATEVSSAERRSANATELARKLLVLVFRKELEERPDEICCSKSEGRELLDQEKLRGIRLQVHKKFYALKGIKYGSSEEDSLWVRTRKKMNAHIRYKRSQKTKQEAVLPSIGDSDSETDCS